ncbi:MAG: hypothetical protein WBD51_05865, partial [Burkholderiaceae bacterium]
VSLATQGTTDNILSYLRLCQPGVFSHRNGLAARWTDFNEYNFAYAYAYDIAIYCDAGNKAS